MAYQTEAVTAMTDIPALVAAFADAEGWTVDVTSPNAPIFTLPTTDTLIDWQLTAAVSGVDHTLTWTANGSAVPTSSANTRSPKLAPASGTTPDVPPPATLHMFISPAPAEEPYLAIVIEYLPNLFRHLYLGRMERLGDYAGGEVIAATQNPMASSTSTIDYNNFDHVQHLFTSRSDVWSSTQCGGVHIDHADNPDPWRKFRGQNTGGITSLPSDAVLGGANDGINDGYLANGESNFAGLNPLISINLYAVKPITGDCSFIPIGRPAGVRLVNMRNLDPGDSIEIASTTWRVFPGMAKSAEVDMPRDASHGNWRTFETSHYIGYAYPEN